VQQHHQRQRRLDHDHQLPARHRGVDHDQLHAGHFVHRREHDVFHDGHGRLDGVEHRNRRVHQQQ
jgi:hypothetical protein